MSSKLEMMRNANYSKLNKTYLVINSVESSHNNLFGYHTSYKSALNMVKNELYDNCNFSDNMNNEDDNLIVSERYIANTKYLKFDSNNGIYIIEIDRPFAAEDTEMYRGRKRYEYSYFEMLLTQFKYEVWWFTDINTEPFAKATYDYKQLKHENMQFSAELAKYIKNAEMIE
jgi:hypothetical protein